MKDEQLNIPAEEHQKLSSLINTAKRILQEKRPNQENLSLGTLEYLKKYRINT